MTSARLTTLIGSVAVFMIAIELTIISVALPEMERAFDGTSRSTLSWVFTAYNVGVASLLLIFGWAAERTGRKRVFVAGLGVFVIGSLVSGLAPTIGILILGRSIQAVGGAMLLPASLALILAANVASHRDSAIGIWGAMAGLAAAIGPSLGAVLVEWAGWRWVFLVNIPIALAVLLLGTRHLAESRDPDIPSRVDVVAVPAGAAAVGLLVLALVAGESLGWFSAATIALVVAATALGSIFWHRSTSHDIPVFDPGLAQLKSFRIAAAGTLCFVAGFTGWLVLAPTFLTEVWDYSILRAGFAIAPGPVAMAIVAGPAGAIAARRGHRPVIVIGAVASAAAALSWVMFVTDTPAYVTTFLPGLVLLGVGVGMGFPMLTAAAMVDVPPRQYAMAAAGNTTVRQVAMAVGIGLAIAIVGTPQEAGGGPDPFRASWAACAGLFLATCAAVALLPERSIGAVSNQEEAVQHAR